MTRGYVRTSNAKRKQRQGNGPYNRGRIPANANPRTLRDLIRRHLREEGKTISGDLARAWDVKPNSASRRMFRNVQMLPEHVEAVIVLLNLDEFDAHELRMQGAIESGWRVDIGRHLENSNADGRKGAGQVDGGMR